MRCGLLLQGIRSDKNKWSYDVGDDPQQVSNRPGDHKWNFLSKVEVIEASWGLGLSLVSASPGSLALGLARSVWLAGDSAGIAGLRGCREESAAQKPSPSELGGFLLLPLTGLHAALLFIIIDVVILSLKVETSRFEVVCVL